MLSLRPACGSLGFDLPRLPPLPWSGLHLLRLPHHLTPACTVRTFLSLCFSLVVTDGVQRRPTRM